MASYVRRGGKSKGVPAAEPGDVSDAQKEAFFRKLESDFEPSVKVACQSAGITKPQYDQLIATDREFVSKLREFRDKQLDDLEDSLYRAATHDSTLAWKLLQANRPEKYGSKAKLDVNHTIKRAEDLQGLSDEEFAKLQAEVCQ